MKRHSPNRLVLCLAAAIWCAAVAVPWAAAQQADIVLHNGKILTVDKTFTVAQAIAITGSKITAVGRARMF